MKTLGRVVMSLILMVTISGCASSPKITWYNADKTGQQQREDEFDCRYKASQMAHARADSDLEEKYFSECMDAKGYIPKKK